MSAWLLKDQQQKLKVLGSLIALGSLFFLLRQQSLEEILNAVQQISAQRFIIVLGLISVSRFFVIGRWYILLRSGGIELSFGRVAAITFTGLFASNFLPSTVGGDLVRVGGIIQSRYDRTIGTASILVDRLIGMLGMTMIAPFGMFSLYRWYLFQPEILHSAIATPSIFREILNLLKTFFRALQIWVKKPMSLLGSLLCTWGHMLCLFVAIQVISVGLGESIQFWELAGIWSVAYFIALVPITFNGYGLQEFSVTYLLSNVAGFSVANSLVIALLVRIVFTIASLPGAFYLSTILSSVRSSRTST